MLCSFGEELCVENIDFCLYVEGKKRGKNTVSIPQEQREDAERERGTEICFFLWLLLHVPFFSSSCVINDVLLLVCLPIPTTNIIVLT